MWKEFIRGRGVAPVAEKLGISRQTLYNYLNDVSPTVPDDLKEKIVAMSNGELIIMDFFEKRV